MRASPTRAYEVGHWRGLPQKKKGYSNRSGLRDWPVRKEIIPVHDVRQPCAFDRRNAVFVVTGRADFLRIPAQL
jgi:hypothetical protein